MNDIHRRDTFRHRHRRKRPAGRSRRSTALVSTGLVAVASGLAWLSVSPHAGAADGPVARIDWTTARSTSSNAKGVPEWVVKLNGCGSSASVRLFRWELALPDGVEVIEAPNTRQDCEVPVTVRDPGSYPVQLTVTDADGAQASTSGTVVVPAS